MRFVQAADFHLHPGHPERLEALAEVVRRAQEVDADALLIPGDLFDEPGGAMPLRSRVRETLERFAGTTVVIPGNHDRRPGGATAFPTGADYGRRTVLLDDAPWAEHRLDGPQGEVRVVGAPFRRGSTLGRDLAGLRADPARTVLLAHGTLFDPRLDGLVDEERAYYPIRAEDLEGRFAYAALGHLHACVTFEGWTAQRAWGYAGSPVSITRGESGPRHAVVVDFEPGHGVRKLSPLRLATPYWATVRETVSPWEDPGALVERVERSLREASEPPDAYRRVRLLVDGHLDGDEAALRRALDRAVADWRPSHREVEIACEVATVHDLLRRNPWLDDLLRRVRRLAATRETDDEVLRRASAFLLEAVEGSGA